MGHKPTLQDLKDVHPTIHASLQKLLAQDNAAQLGLVFQVLSGLIGVIAADCFLCILCMQIFHYDMLTV